MISVKQTPQLVIHNAKSTIIPFVNPMSQEAPRISVVVPTKNEAKNLPHVLPLIPEWVHEIVLVDGNSTDNTVEVARQLVPDKLKVVMQTGRGKGNALRAGFKAASGDIIIMIDADGSMTPREFPMFVGALLSGADFVKGSRFMQGGGTDDMELYRFLGNWGLTTVVRILFGGGYSDLCYGYAAFWKRVLPKLDLRSDGFEIETEMNVRALKTKIKVVEIPSFEAPRIYGTSNLNTIRDGFRVLRQIFKEFFGWDRARNKRESEVEYYAAVQLLEREAKHLSIMRHHLSPQAYSAAKEALEVAQHKVQEMYSFEHSTVTA